MPHVGHHGEILHKLFGLRI